MRPVLKTPSPGRTGSRSWCRLSSDPSGSGRASSSLTALVPTSMAARTVSCGRRGMSGLAHVTRNLPRVSVLTLMSPMDSGDPRQFLNRELSWLEFNERVLGEARDASLPLYERLKFLG